ncbi:tRNA(Ile)-lysidine synthase [Pseudovibrio axinellae]|uniref:tRNA(Ile)-lysidine synthase n=1 Tax=Pseudovibrio axinellae TaxID=989403 RepID=A0A166ABZ4_9HYPH|nr:tRNA lysidine(34) synthetase TilS [Pseudovibrio axinellae]KZL20849.1 tRNA(Ile)-lysidine synthase [Pseudovibrio axinellae]SER20776.1 tRNA(Ile)-lysidine synthase [Pseudovibrio axinellae]
MTTASNQVAQFSFEELDALFGEYKSFRRIAIGVSGGVDSMGLLYLLKQWAQDVGAAAPELYAFTVNHGLRAEAAGEAAGVAQYCTRLKVPHEILNWVGDKPSSNIQSEARDARHALLRQAAEHQGCEALVLAHHLEDQAETFLTRLARGSGVYGLAGIRKQRELDGFHICRPLLDIKKERLKAALEASNVQWFEDPSNEDEQFTRVKFRQAQQELDALGLTTSKLADTAHRMARAADAIDAWVDEIAEKSCTFHSAGPVRFDSSCLEYLPDEIGLRLIGRLVRYISGAPYVPRLAKLEGLYETLKRTDGARAATLGGVQFVLAKPLSDAVWFCFREAGRTGLSEVNVSPGDEGIWDRRWRYKAEHSCQSFRITSVQNALCGDFELEIPVNWLKTAFLTAPLIVFASGVSYMPWKKIGRTAADAAVRSKTDGISMVPVSRTF